MAHVSHSDQDRRKAARAPIELRVEYKRLNSFFADYTKNISKGGTFIRTSRPLDIGTEFVFRLVVPKLSEDLSLRGRVQWVVRPEDAQGSREPGMGIGFVYDTEADRERIATVVEKLMTEALGPVLVGKLLGKARGDESGLGIAPDEARSGFALRAGPRPLDTPRTSHQSPPMTDSTRGAGIDPGLDLETEVARLKRERNAVILAHYYQDSEIQDLADFIGDSLQLAQAAKSTRADVIAFCGVHFMAETAKILNPDRVVVLPDPAAGCSLADGCPPDRFLRWRAKYPDAVAVTYINCSAEVKAASDVICTSSNAVKIVRSIPAERRILFAPDKNLGRYVARESGRELILWQGSCIVHETFSERKLVELVTRHPDAEVIAHPECEEPLLRMAQFIGSTSALLKHAVESPKEKFIVLTEVGILHQMQKAAPHKTFIPSPPEGNCSCNECPHMRRNTLEKLYLCLRDLSPRIEMPEALRAAAARPIERMLELSA
jgi:quinolinate synthase